MAGLLVAFVSITLGFSYGGISTKTPRSECGQLSTASIGSTSTIPCPRTPGDNLLMTDWVTDNIEVTIRDKHDPGLVRQIGVVRTVSGAMCSVFVPEEDKVVNIMCADLHPVRPRRGDMFKVIVEDERDKTGELLSIDRQDGVVKIVEDITMFPMEHLCKMWN